MQIQTNTIISADDTLIILDEIQSAERGITSLKYFCEKAPQYHIIAAGSLLGLSLHQQISFPVGKVDFLDLYPMTFFEFLLALGEDLLVDALKKREWSIISVFETKLTNYLRYYFYVGGMPEAVGAFVDTKDWSTVRLIQKRILNSYEADFSKHAPSEIIPRIRMVWQNIPQQLSKENKKFVYGNLKAGARAKDFELAIQWIIDYGLIVRCPRVSKPAMPLVAYQNLAAFKLFFNDIGLLSAMSNLEVTTLLNGDTIFTEYKGALAEQYVFQELRCVSERYIGYWTNNRSTAEVDFVVQEKENVIPIEVKASENLKAKSFKLFCEKFQPQQAIRTSLAPYKEVSWMTNIPLYAIEILNYTE